MHTELLKAISSSLLNFTAVNCVWKRPVDSVSSATAVCFPASIANNPFVGAAQIASTSAYYQGSFMPAPYFYY